MAPTFSAVVRRLRAQPRGRHPRLRLIRSARRPLFNLRQGGLSPLLLLEFDASSPPSGSSPAVWRCPVEVQRPKTNVCKTIGTGRTQSIKPTKLPIRRDQECWMRKKVEIELGIDLESFTLTYLSRKLSLTT
jgi:hypothetical protein